MTVAALNPVVAYLEDGATVNFPLPFRFLSPAAIRASRQVQGAHAVDLVYGVDYTVTGGSTDAGGTLTVTSPAAAGVKLSAWRDTQLSQTTDYTTGDRFPAESHERVLDQLMLLLQEHHAVLLRSFKVPFGEPGPLFRGIQDATEGAILGFHNGFWEPLDNSVWEGWRDDALQAINAANLLLQAAYQQAMTNMKGYADAAAAAAHYYQTKAAGAAATASGGIYTSDEDGVLAYYRSTGGGGYVLIDYVTPSRRWFVDPAAGSDVTGNGLRATPYKTIANCISKGLRAGHELIVLGLDAVIKEEVSIPGGVRIRPDQGRACFNGFDPVAAGAWSFVGTDAGTGVTYTNLYKATLANILNGPANRIYPMMFRKDTGINLVEFKLAPSDVSPYSFNTRAECLAAVEATPSSFFQECSNGGRYDLGFTPGGTISYYVNVGANPGANMLQGQRNMPVFGAGCVVTDFDFFGGIGHNGAQFQLCHVERCSLYHSAAHGCFCAGATMVDCLVANIREDSGTSYGYHGYNVPTAFVGRTYLLRCGVQDCTGTFATGFGSHGIIGAPAPIMGSFDLDDCWAERVTVCMGFGDVLYGSTIRNFRGREVTTFGGSACNLEVHNVDIVFAPCPRSPFGTFNASVSGYSCPTAGLVHNYYGGKSAAYSGAIFRVSTPSTGIANFYDHAFLLNGDDGNGFYAQILGACNFVFTRCALQGFYRSESNTLWSLQQNAAQNFTFIDSAVSGFILPSLGTTTLTNTQVGGDLGISPDVDNSVRISANSVFSLLGYTSRDAAGSMGQYAIVLTGKGVVAMQATPVTHALPPGTWNRIAMVGSGGAVYMVIVGAGGALAYKAYNVGVGTAWTLVDTTGFTSINWTGVVGGSTDGKTWLLGSDGSITEYTIAGALTARSSGVAFGLTGGVRNGTTVLAWGSNGDGTAETAGGVVVSTDAGATWAASLANGDAAPAGIGAFAYRIKTGGYVNGVYFLAGTRGTFLTSPSGASGSWTSRSGKVNSQFSVSAVDTTNNVIILGANGFSGALTRTTALYKVDANGQNSSRLAGSKAYDPPSLADGAGATTTVTVTGAALGDYVPDVSFTQDLSGLTVTAWVSAPDIVTVRFQNESGAVVDLASGTLRVTVKGSGTNPAAWPMQEIASPLPHLGGLAWVPQYQLNPGSAPQFIAAGAGMIASTESLGVWRKYRPSPAWQRKPPSTFTARVKSLAAGA